MTKLQIFASIFAIHNIIFLILYASFFFFLFGNSLLNWFKWNNARSNKRKKEMSLLTKNSTGWHDMCLCKDKGLSIDGHYGLGNGVRKPSSDC